MTRSAVRYGTREFLNFSSDSKRTRDERGRQKDIGNESEKLTRFIRSEDKCCRVVHVVYCTTPVDLDRRNFPSRCMHLTYGIIRSIKAFSRHRVDCL
jgi:hypothetical protein